MSGESEEEVLSGWTLGDIKAMGMVLEGTCPSEGCSRFSRFDLDALIARFGNEWQVPAALPARCDACGAQLRFQVATLHDDEDG